MKSQLLVLLFTIAIALCGCYVQLDDHDGYSNSRLASATHSDSIPPPEPTKREKRRQWKKGHVYVTRVIDGDTFWVDNGTDQFKVRFIGIDAPETRNVGRKKKGYFAEEAKDYVVNQTLHKWVRLELDVQEKDRYQRLLAYVYLADGTFLNAHLVAGGYAIVDTYPPNVKYVDLFTELQRQARQEKSGLWADLPR